MKFIPSKSACLSLDRLTMASPQRQFPKMCSDQSVFVESIVLQHALLKIPLPDGIGFLPCEGDALEPSFYVWREVLQACFA